MKPRREATLLYTMSSEFIEEDAIAQSEIDTVRVVEVNKIISIIGVYTNDGKKFYDRRGNLLLIDGGGRIICMEDDELYKSSFVNNVYKNHTEKPLDNLSISYFDEEESIDNKTKKEKLTPKELIKKETKPEPLVNQEPNKANSNQVKSNITKKAKANNDTKELKKYKVIIDSDVDVEVYSGKDYTPKYELKYIKESQFKNLSINFVNDTFVIKAILKEEDITSNSVNTSITINGNTNVVINGKKIDDYSNDYMNSYGKLIVYVDEEKISSINIKTLSSDINVEAKIKQITANSVSGSIRIFEGIEIVTCESVSGDIYLNTKPEKAISADLKSLSGDIECAIDNVLDATFNLVKLVGKIKNSYKRTGTATGVFRCNTMSGDINIYNAFL